MNTNLLSASAEVLPLALVIALSPFTVVLAVLVVQGNRPRASGLAYLAGWLCGITVLIAMFTALPEAMDPDESYTPEWSAWTRILVGGALIAVGIYRWTTRGNRSPQLPGVDRLTGTSPVKVFGLRLVLTMVNFKVLFICVAAGLVISNAHLGRWTPVAAATFVVTAASTVAIPILGYLFTGDRFDATLTRMRIRLEKNSPALIAVTLIAIGVLVLQQGVLDA